MFRIEERANFMIKSNQRQKEGKETLTCAIEMVKIEMKFNDFCKWVSCAVCGPCVDLSELD